MQQDALWKLIEDKLNEGGLGDHLDKGKSQLLEFPEEYFAEVVLDDASKIDEAEAILQKVGTKVASKNRKLDYMVRALWHVQEVKPQFNDNGLRDLIEQGIFSLPFIAMLKSGSKEQRVGVEVMPQAYQDLDRAGKGDNQTLRDIVKASLEGWLSIGGAGYWDPVREPRRAITAGEVSYVLAHGLATVR